MKLNTYAFFFFMWTDVTTAIKAGVPRVIRWPPGLLTNHNIYGEKTDPITPSRKSDFP